jgi:hypothetical protein
MDPQGPRAFESPPIENRPQGGDSSPRRGRRGSLGWAVIATLLLLVAIIVLIVLL